MVHDVRMTVASRPGRSVFAALASAVCLAGLLGSCSGGAGSAGTSRTDSQRVTSRSDAEAGTEAETGTDDGTSGGGHGGAIAERGADPAEGGADPAGDGAPAVPSPGCSSAAMAPVTKERRTLTVDGAQRWYLVTVPPEATDPAPLVLDFHGLSEGAEFHSRTSGYSELAAEEGFVVAFPHGSRALASWSVDPAGSNADTRFIDDLVAQLGDDLCIDTSRIYATGLSNGAVLSSVLGCTRAGAFAAVAPVAGVSFPDPCDPGVPVPLITFHGTADPILMYNGGVGGVLPELLSGKPITPTTLPAPDLDGAGFPAAAAAWATANGCGEFTDERVSETIVHRVWDCPRLGETEFWIVLGGGHTWPGSDGLIGGFSQIFGSTTMEIDATRLSWEFFERHRRTAVADG